MNPPGEEETGAARPIYAFGPPRRPPAEPIPVVLLGATGSIGTQTLDLVERFPERLRLTAVSVRSRDAELAERLERLDGARMRPRIAIVDPTAHTRARRNPRLAPSLLAPGSDGLAEAIAAAPADACVVNGIVGAAGLEPTLAAARRGLRIALANKESLVVGGELVGRAVAEGGAELIPVDSEHSAIAQCLAGRTREEVARVILTASGGPFLRTPLAALAEVTVAEALAHPTWNMGPKVTVDSATLMNKGLEVLEARHLFGLADSEVEVVVHPGSHIHSAVEFRDKAVVAQLGTPDMRLPLLYALAGERRWPLAAPRLDLLAVGNLRFEAPDLERFPCLRLAREAGRAGGRAPIVLNAANEVAVAALLSERIRFMDIPRVIESTLAELGTGSVATLAEALAIDAAARARASHHAGSESVTPAESDQT
jgi:1-deoxy-D-xylulose-5-phosphate reductoisomerase